MKTTAGRRYTGLLFLLIMLWSSAGTAQHQGACFCRDKAPWWEDTILGCWNGEPYIYITGVNTSTPFHSGADLYVPAAEEAQAKKKYGKGAVSEQACQAEKELLAEEEAARAAQEKAEREAREAARAAKRAEEEERERLVREERARIAAEQRAQEEAEEQALAASLIEQGKFRLACRIGPKDEYFSLTYIFQFRNADQSGSFQEYTLTTIADPDAIEYGRTKWEDFRFLNDDNKARFLEMVEEARGNDLRTLRNWESFYSVTPHEYVLDGNKVRLLEEVIPTFICQEQGLKECVRFLETPAIHRSSSYYESEHGNAPCKVSPESPEALINSHYDRLLEWWESKETARL